jgi:DNA polymerase III delta subunit
MDARKPSRRSPTRSSAARPRAGEAGGPARPARAAVPRGGGGGALDAFALFARFDRDAFPATLYLEGPCEPLKAALLVELRAAWAARVPQAPAARVLRAAENGVEEILAAYQGASLFAPRELTVVLDVEDLARSDKRVAALAAGLARPAGGSCLALVESEAESPRKKLDPLRAACEARWVALPPGRADLAGWGARRQAREGVAADPGVLEQAVEACEGDALAFFNELEKLSVWAGASRRIRAEDAEALLRPVVGADLPEYLAAVALGRVGPASQRLGRLLATGVSEGQVLFALSNLVGGALGGWAKYRDASAALSRRVRPAELAAAVDALYRAEAAWKGGRADAVAVLEQATRALCGVR